jgi:hypothetical protein
MSSSRLNDKDDAPPHDEAEALVWIIDRYIDVCEWESVLTCFNEYASIIAAANAASYITCIRHALVAIINCQRNRYDHHHPVPAHITRDAPHVCLTLSRLSTSFAPSAPPTHSLILSCKCAQLRSTVVCRMNKEERCKNRLPKRNQPCDAYFSGT